MKGVLVLRFNSPNRLKKAYLKPFYFLPTFLPISQAYRYYFILDLDDYVRCRQWLQNR